MRRTRHDALARSVLCRRLAISAMHAHTRVCGCKIVWQFGAQEDAPSVLHCASVDVGQTARMLAESHELGF